MRPRRDETGILGESTAYRDSKVPKRHLPTIRVALRQHLLPDEQLLGLFTVWRLRRSVSLLVVTDRRFLTLGDREKGMPVVDEVYRSEVTALKVEREKTFSSGTVVAETGEGRTHLGVLDYAADGSTFLGLDEVLARDAGRPDGMQVIPVPGQQWSGAPPSDDALPARVPVPDPAGASSESEDDAAHPLVRQLQALAALRRDGALTEAEFVAAKQKLLADEEGR